MAALIPTSAHGGGSAFNGGTITDPLTILPAAAAVPFQAYLAPGDAGPIAFFFDFDGVIGMTISASQGITFLGTASIPVFEANLSGGVRMQNLPTVDPHVVGALWNNAGSMKISAG